LLDFFPPGFTSLVRGNNQFQWGVGIDLAKRRKKPFQELGIIAEVWDD